MSSSSIIQITDEIPKRATLTGVSIYNLNPLQEYGRCAIVDFS
jgi:hypothetical protein